MSQKFNIFLIGPMGAGKTSVGKLLAKTLELEFFDSDSVIETLTGANIPWIFDIEGEKGFRLREKKAIDWLTQKKGVVVATGGGVVLDQDNRSNLFANGIVIYLNVSIEEQLRRTYRSSNRPLLLNSNPREVFERLHEERDVLYREIANYVVDTNHGSIRMIVESILNYVNSVSKE